MAANPEIPIAALLERFAADRRHWLGLPGALVVPPVVAAKLANLTLLDGVPFNHLVPDERLLPVVTFDPDAMGTIQFFHVDPNWIAALLDGATSVGRSADVDKSHDEALGPGVSASAIQGAAGIRAGHLGAFAGAAPMSGLPAAGFLMRSQVLEHWPGLEVTAYAGVDGSQPVHTLRMERLSPSVLLCLFDAPFERVDFTEPAEGIHFSVDEGTSTTFTKGLRNLGLTSAADIGEPIAGTEVTIPFRGERVIDIQALQGLMEAELVAKGYWDSSRPFTAAEFAIQMLEGAAVASFQASTPATGHPRPPAALDTITGLQADGESALDRFVTAEVRRG